MEFYDGPNLRLDHSALDRMLNSPNGEVGRHMRWIGLKIMAGAKRMVGVDTGRLRASIYMTQGRNLRSQYVQVGSNLNYAYMHHEGTRAHVINAHQGRLMRFNSRGRVVYARKVINPGTRGNPYLTVPLRRTVR